MNDVLDKIVAEDDCSAEFYMEPPVVHELTDEDSGDDGNFAPANLNGNQLLAPTTFRQNKSSCVSQEEDSNQPLTKKAKICKLKAKNVVKEWSYDAPTISMPDFPPCDLSACDDKALSELFELFFDDKIIQHIVDHSQEYCSSKNLLGKYKCNQRRNLLLPWHSSSHWLQSIV